MELLSQTVGPLATNVYVLADSGTHEAIAVDTAIPSVAWLSGMLDERGWKLRLIVSTHGHWDHVGDNAAVQAWTHDHQPGDEARIAVHPLDREMLLRPQPLFAPFPIPPSVPAVDLAEGGRVRFGEIDLEVLHTPDTPRVRSACSTGRTVCCSRVTRCSPGHGAGPISPADPRNRWRSR